MKRKIVIPTPFFILLIAVSLVSLTANLIQFVHSNSDEFLPIIGSYCTSTFSTDSTYIVFDKNKSYTLYNQKDGILEQGNYTEYINHQYSLEGDSGNDGNVILTEEGLYYIPNDASVTFFQRFSDIPTYIGNWVLDSDIHS